MLPFFGVSLVEQIKKKEFYNAEDNSNLRTYVAYEKDVFGDLYTFITRSGLIQECNLTFYTSYKL